MDVGPGDLIAYDKSIAKKRPALVLSNADFNRSNHTILAMMTTKHLPPWPGDSPIRDYKYQIPILTYKLYRIIYMSW